MLGVRRLGAARWHNILTPRITLNERLERDLEWQEEQVARLQEANEQPPYGRPTNLWLRDGDGDLPSWLSLLHSLLQDLGCSCPKSTGSKSQHCGQIVARASSCCLNFSFKLA